MTNVLIRKLEAIAPLSDDDRALLDRVIRNPKLFGPREDLVREGETPGNVRLILEGFACRYKDLPNGRRQIMAYLLPGDLCDINVFILKAMDHNIATLSACSVIFIPREDIIALTERPAIARALWWATLVDEATLREWIVNVGARQADERIAHLLCELLIRLRAVGLAKEDQYELPITQAELGQTVGLSAVHINRALQRLRRLKLITLKHRRLVILDFEQLRVMSGFRADYLHLAEPERAVEIVASHG